MSGKQFLLFWGIVALSAIPVIGIMKTALESHAQSPYVVSAASPGVLSGVATVVQDNTATTGEAVQFGVSAPNLLQCSED